MYRGTSSNGGDGTRNGEDGMSSFIMSKIMGAYKTTKESPYVKSLYNETSSAFNLIDHSAKSTGNNANGAPNNEFLEKLPENTQITLYPNYCKHESGEYITRVKGVVTAVGITSRKNRFLLSMARRITKSSDGISEPDNAQVENEMHDAITNQEHYKPSDDDSVVSGYANSILPDDIVKARMEGIMAKTVVGTPLNITIGSDEPVDNLVGAKLTTDNFGIFQMSLVTPYKPSYIAVSSDIDASILQTTTVEIVESTGISIITDIDDTIRKTGVLGDKRDVFRNIFSKPYSSCEIAGVCGWYQEMHDVYKCPIHYVSNSPWQIFNVVSGFMDYFGFPVTSIHLRQYSGNLVSSFTQPSAERKRPSLVSLLQEFPDRKFILVGDTGEQDLEAYLSLLPHFSPQIVAIYLRVVPLSFSSLGNEELAYAELKKMLEKRNGNTGVIHGKVDYILKNPTGIDSDDESDEGLNGSVNFDPTKRLEQGRSRRRSSLNAAKQTLTQAVKLTREVNKKLPPIVPKKPDSLKANKIEPVPPPMSAPGNVDQINSQKPSDGSGSEQMFTNNSSYGYGRGRAGAYDYDLDKVAADAAGEPYDKRFSIWKQRVQRIVDEVPEHIEVAFWEDANSVHDASVKLVINELK